MFTFLCEQIKNAHLFITIVESSKTNFPLLRCQIGHLFAVFMFVTCCTDLHFNFVAFSFYLFPE